MRISDWSSDVCSSDLELKYIKAKDLAYRLSGVVGGSSSGGRATGGDGNVSLMPGSDPFSIGGAGGKDDDYSDAGIDSGMGSGMGSGTGIGDGSLSLDPREDGNASVTLQVEGDRVGVSAVDRKSTRLNSSH